MNLCEESLHETETSVTNTYLQFRTEFYLIIGT